MKKIILSLCIAFAIARLQAQNVGINTTTPTRPLTVFANTFGMVQTNGVDTMGTWISPSGTPLPYAWVGTLTNVPLRMSSGRDNNHISIMNNGKVGIGNGVQTPTSPALLEIDGQIKINGGTPGTGKVLTTDATGLASWETPSGGFTLPYSGSSNSIGTASLIIANTASSLGVHTGIVGQASNGIGVFGQANSPSSLGVYGQSVNGIGVVGSSDTGIALRGFSGSGNSLYLETNGGTTPTATIFNSGTGNAVEAYNNSATNATGKFVNNNATGLALQTNGGLKFGGSGVGTPATGKVLTATDNLGNATWQTPSGGSGSWTTSGINTYNTVSGKVGINTTTPTRPLTVRAETYGIIQTNGEDTAAIYTSPLSATNRHIWFGSMHSGVPVYFGAGNFNHISIMPNGKVAIGASVITPSSPALLEIDGRIKINGGTPGTGKVLTTDATGLASWEIPVSGSNNWTASGADIYNNNAGNVELNGFTKLGNDATAPKIKMKKITGTTTTADNTFRMMPHGVDASKILSISTLVTDGGYQYLPHSPDAGAIYTVNVDGANIAIGVKTAALSSSVMGKPFKILITYEE